ncbi:MAG TPA: PAS domain S-box protein [Blastocatellia bacterium]|nr:PAS domain S-box protein [Blastocatellia bacterium]
MAMKLKEWLSPPRLPDEGRNRASRTFHVIALGFLIGSALMAVSNLVGEHYRTSASAASVFGATLGAMWLARRGHLQLASWVVLIALTGILTYFLGTGNGIHDFALVVYPTVIIAASLLLSKRGFAALSVMTILSVGGIVYGEVYGVIVTKYSSETSYDDIITLSILLGVTAIFVRTLADNLLQSTIRAQRNEGALAESNSELQARTLELEQQGAALRHERDLVSRLMETSPVGIAMINRSGRITFANGRAEEILGLSRDEITQRHYNAPQWKITDDAGAPIRDEQLVFRLVVDSGEPAYDVHHAIEWPDGRRVYLSVNGAPLLDQAGHIDGMVAAFEDITERLRADEAVRDSEQKFHKTFNANPSPMMISSLEDSRIIDVNDSFLATSGYTREEVIGRTPLDINTWVDPRDRERLLATLAEHKSVRAQESSFWMKDGEIRTFLVSAEVVELGGERCVLTATTDITDRKRAEEASTKKAEQTIRHQKALLELSQMEVSDLDATLQRITELDCATLGVERVGVWLFNEDRSAIICNDLYQMNKQSHQSGLKLEAKQYPRYFHALATNRVVGAHDAETDPRTSEFAEHHLRPLRISSMMDVPVRLRGKVVGVVCHEHVGPMRHWTPEEQDFAASVADLVSLALEASERRRAEEGRRESEERLRLALDAAQMVIWDWNTLDGNVNWSGNLERLLGLAPGAFGGDYGAFVELLHSEDRDDVTRDMQRALDEGGDYYAEFRIVWPDGTIRWIAAKGEAFCDNSGRPARMLGVGTDITDRKRAEAEQARLQAAIQSAATEWQLTFDAIESPVLMLDIDARVRRMNNAARELTGTTWEDNLGHPVEQLGSGEPWRKTAEIANLVAATNAGTSLEVKDGPTGKTWDISASLFTIPGSDDRRIIVVARDITRTVELQESLRRSETMSAMGQLVAGVAHEVRNPLFSISATLDAFQVNFGAKSEYQRYVEVLHGEVGRLSSLMQDLLDYGRPPSLELAEGSIADVIARAIRSCAPLAERLQVRIASSVERELGLLVMDRKRLTQVFQNLVENALQHSPPGSDVTVAAKEVHRGSERWVDCRVKDRGPGIQDEVKSRIFEPFFTRRRGGTGLGLSIVQRIVEQHGGTISAGTAADGGAEITVRLPLVAHRGGQDSGVQRARGGPAA